MQLIHSVVVGSRLHNLYNEDSDTDFRGIHLSNLSDILSPFKKHQDTSWIEGDEDNTSYELMKFCRMAVSGNPSALEILYSDIVRETSLFGNILIKNKIRFLNSHNIYEAHKGYAHNQYRKMNFHDPDQRTPKFAVAYLRSLKQGTDLLMSGIFNPRMEGKFRHMLMKVKYDFDNFDKAMLSNEFTRLQKELNDAYIENQNRFVHDEKWIETFIYQVYTDRMKTKDLFS